MAMWKATVIHTVDEDVVCEKGPANGQRRVETWH